MTAYVYSTLTSDVSYTVWADGGGDVKRIAKSILIMGGTGVANKRLITPYGVRTEITDDEVGLLIDNKVFQLHEKNGFVKIETVKADADVVAADMVGRDRSAPLIPEDFEESDVVPVAGNKPKKGKSKE